MFKAGQEVKEIRVPKTFGSIAGFTALSRKTDTEAATRDLANAIRIQIGTAPIDLVFVFFSAHHAAKASMISSMLQKDLRAKVFLGCSGEGVIAGATIERVVARKALQGIVTGKT